MTFMVLALSACNNQADAQHHLEAEGYTNIKTLGTGFSGCPTGDLFRTAFRAVDPTGGPVAGTVCGDGTIVVTSRRGS